MDNYAIMELLLPQFTTGQVQQAHNLSKLVAQRPPHFNRLIAHELGY